MSTMFGCAESERLKRTMNDSRMKHFMASSARASVSACGLPFLLAWLVGHLAVRGFGPGLVSGAHGGDALGLLRGEVVQLRAVGDHVVEFPLARLVHRVPHKFPWSLTHGAIACPLPEECVVGCARATL